MEEKGYFPEKAISQDIHLYKQTNNLYLIFLENILVCFDELFLLQLRGAQILDAVRLHKNGFPESLTYGEFWRRYRILSDDLHPHKKEPGHQEMKSAVEELLGEMDLDKSAFRLGNTQVGNLWFFPS